MCIRIGNRYSRLRILAALTNYLGGRGRFILERVTIGKDNCNDDLWKGLLEEVMDDLLRFPPGIMR